jgi:hypothetical protein
VFCFRSAGIKRLRRAIHRTLTTTSTMAHTILVARWADGIHVFSDTGRRHELTGRAVHGLARDADGHALAIVDGRSLCRRAATGEWTVLAQGETPLACAVAVGPRIYVGTDDARVLRLTKSGVLEPLGTFDAVQGRTSWFAGGVEIDGVWMGPPLGVRSLTATADRAILLANVHVGGVPRSDDGGVTWHATIAVESDVHQVLAHPSDPNVVVAATAAGLGVSQDAGRTWVIETEGLPSAYCSAVMFNGSEVLVSASPDHFAAAGGVYRRALSSPGTLAPIGGGFPANTVGIVDTGCMDSNASTLAIADQGGNLYVSSDGGGAWSRHAAGLVSPSSVLVV